MNNASSAEMDHSAEDQTAGELVKSFLGVKYILLTIFTLADNELIMKVKPPL